GELYPMNNRATAQPGAGSKKVEAQLGEGRQAAGGLTLDHYARAKGLPIEFLKSLGLSQFSYDGQPAVRMPYRGLGGDKSAVRFRFVLEGDRFRWKLGNKACL